MITMLAALIAAMFAAEPAPNLTGTWNMGLQGGHVVPVALVLKQDGTTVTGTITIPTQRVGETTEIALAGRFESGALNLAGTVDGAAEPTTIAIEGTLQDDGSMEGSVAMVAKETHRVRWTAERLKERKP
jgi:hypothetical protein